MSVRPDLCVRLWESLFNTLRRERPSLQDWFWWSCVTQDCAARGRSPAPSWAAFESGRPFRALRKAKRSRPSEWCLARQTEKTRGKQMEQGTDARGDSFLPRASSPEPCRSQKANGTVDRPLLRAGLGDRRFRGLSPSPSPERAALLTQPRVESKRAPGEASTQPWDTRSPNKNQSCKDASPRKAPATSGILGPGSRTGDSPFFEPAQGTVPFPEP